MLISMIGSKKINASLIVHNLHNFVHWPEIRLEVQLCKWTTVFVTDLYIGIIPHKL